jgi:hypothetical protein
MRALTTISILLFMYFIVLTGCGQKFPRGKFQAEEPGDIVTLDFTNSSEYRVYVNGGLVDIGTFSIQGNEIIWETSTYCKARGSEKATYTWTLDNDTLRFQVKGEDNCGPRFDDFQYTYRRVE